MLDDKELIEHLIKKPYKFELDIGSKLPSNEKDLNLFNSVKEYLETNLFTYTSPEGAIFKLPESSFKDKKIDYFDDFDKELHYPEGASFDFNEEQLQNIWKDGTFKADSVVSEVPYVWKMSNLVCSGKENIHESFATNLSYSFMMINNIKFLYNRKSRFANARYSFKAIYKSIRYMFEIIFGLPFFFNKKGQVDYKVKTDFDKKRVEENPDYIFEVFQENFIKIYTEASKEFEEEWKETRKELVNQSYQEGFSEAEAGKAAENKKFEFFKNFLKSGQFPESFKEMVFTFFDRIWLYNKLKKEYDDECTKRQEDIRKSLKTDYSVKSKVNDWLEERFEEEYNKALLEHDKNLEDKINQNFDAKMAKIIHDWTYFNKNKDKLIEEAEDQVENSQAIENYSVNLMKPYRACEVDDYDAITESCKKTYILEKTRTINLNKSTFGWRFKFLLFELYAIYLNGLVSLYEYTVNSSFGFKGLFGLKPDLTYECDSNTGEITCSSYGYTYCSVVQHFNAEITKDRHHFFANRERSLFGGAFGNFYNWTKNYVIYGTIGNILLLLGYPLICITNILFVTAFFIVLAVFPLIYVILKYLFCILIFDSMNSDNEASGCFPLISCQLYFAINGLLNLLLNPIMLVLNLILSLLVLIYALIAVILTYIYQWIMYRMVRMFGKIPKVRSDLAVPIEGPGVSAKIFNRIEVEDALLFLQVQLEKENLEHFRRQKEKTLDEPKQISMNINSVLSPLGLSHTIDYEYDNYTSKMMSKLHIQIEKRKKVLPSVKKVKFPLNELVMLKTASQEMIQEYVAEHKLTEIWNNYNLIEGTWRRLTDKLLSEAFGQDILEALEDSEVSLKNENIEEDNDWKQMKVEVSSKSRKLKKMNKFKGVSTKAFLSMGSSFKEQDDDYDWYEQERAHYLNKNVSIGRTNTDFFSVSALINRDMFKLDHQLLSDQLKNEFKQKDQLLKKEFLELRHANDI